MWYMYITLSAISEPPVVLMRQCCENTCFSTHAHVDTISQSKECGFTDPISDYQLIASKLFRFGDLSPDFVCVALVYMLILSEIIVDYH